MLHHTVIKLDDYSREFAEHCEKAFNKMRPMRPSANKEIPKWTPEFTRIITQENQVLEEYKECEETVLQFRQMYRLFNFLEYKVPAEMLEGFDEQLGDLEEGVKEFREFMAEQSKQRQAVISKLRLKANETHASMKSLDTHLGGVLKQRRPSPI